MLEVTLAQVWQTANLFVNAFNSSIRTFFDKKELSLNEFNVYFLFNVHCNHMNCDHDSAMKILKTNQCMNSCGDDEIE